MGILSDEQVAQLKADFPGAATASEAAKLREADKREKDKLRKRAERAAKKTAKEQAAAEQQASEAASFPEFWELQRALLTETQRAEYEQRESNVLDLEFAMKKYVAGNYDDVTDPEDRVPLEAIIEEVKLEAEKGLCESIILIIPNLWGEDEKYLRRRIEAKGGPTVDLMKYGYRTGLDSELHERFRRKFMVERHKPAPPEYVVMECPCQTLVTSRESVSASIAAAYKAKGIKWLCTRCRSKETSARAIANKAMTAELRSPGAFSIRDDWGRVKDQ
jgi:hypothetical protein